ncbi:MAG: hypothetical protein U9O94_07365 [Nanoarchaeota archaeon]|nr:hypothetical protein [Nanoarchaeota archaeon]
MVKIAYDVGDRITDYFGKHPQNAIRHFEETPVDVWNKNEVLADKLMGGPEKYGRMHLWEGRMDIHEGWLRGSPILDYVPEQESVGIMIPTKAVYRHHFTNNAGLTLQDAHIDLNMRAVGKFFTIKDNFERNLKNYLKSDEGIKLAIQYNSEGLQAEDIGYIAVGFVPEEAIYAIGRLPNGKVAVYTHRDTHKKIEREARDFDMDSRELVEVLIAEEVAAHHFRKSYDNHFGRVAEEEGTKRDLLEFYSNLEGKTLDSNLKAKYSRIKNHLEIDIATIGRYAKLYSEDICKLEMTLEAEALIEGRGTEKDISDYVSAKMEAIEEALDGENIESSLEAVAEGAEVYAADTAEESGVEGESDGVCAAVDSEGGESGGDGE